MSNWKAFGGGFQHVYNFESAFFGVERSQKLDSQHILHLMCQLFERPDFEAICMLAMIIK